MKSCRIHTVPSNLIQLSVKKDCSLVLSFQRHYGTQLSRPIHCSIHSGEMLLCKQFTGKLFTYTYTADITLTVHYVVV